MDYERDKVIVLSWETIGLCAFNGICGPGKTKYMWSKGHGEFLVPQQG